MALFDFLKRKKEIEKARPVEKKTEQILDAKKTKKEVKASPVKVVAGKSGFSYDIVKEPHISEKSTYLGEINKYVFKIRNNSNKPEIKKSIEGIYGVTVLAVNMVKIPRKKRRLGRSQGFKKGYDKAIVTIKEGEKIEIF